MNPTESNRPSATIAVVFSRLGPYHMARLRGASQVVGEAGGAVAAISIAGMDKIYAWDRLHETNACPTTVLFPDQLYEDLPAQQMASRLKQCLDELNPLAVALPGWAFTEARAGLAWCRQRKRAAILMSESSKHDHFRLWPREFMKQNMVRRFSSALVGGRRHAEYARMLGIPRAAIFKGYDAVDNDYFRTASAAARAEATALRSSLGLPKRYWLTSSRFVPVKNLDGLLRAYALATQRSPDCPDLVICGDGPCRKSLVQLAGELNIATRLHWPGFVQYPDLPKYYALAEVFILASTTEPWGLVVNEAMACGLPVWVSSRCGCTDELVHDGRNGLTFEPEPPESIADALLKIPTSPLVLDEMGHYSQRLVENCSTRVFGEGLLEAARMALARSGRDDFGPPEGGG